MGQISKQERMGLEELFVCIEKSHYSKGGFLAYKRTLQLIKQFSKHYPVAVWHLFKKHA